MYMLLLLGDGGGARVGWLVSADCGYGVWGWPFWGFCGYALAVSGDIRSAQVRVNCTDWFSVLCERLAYGVF